ncbi:MAG: hypothetical protein FJ320_10475 [SAR202 cluster bacterium]|nr:hypothetical protein [SAR202 cluster bacterium]
MGITFPTFTIAVQNAVPYRVMGVATSATQFFRTIGGTLGLAIMGSVMVNRFSKSLLQDTPQQVKDAMTPGTLEAIAHNPQALVSEQGRANLAEAFRGAGEQGPSPQAQLLDTLKEALGGAINEVFIIAVGMIAAAWVVTFFIKEIPLRGRAPAAVPGGPGSGPRAKGTPRPAEGPAGGDGK